MKLREIEKAIMNGLQEECFDGTKALTKAPVFANILFAFQPNVLNRVLFGGIGCKEQTGDPPGRGRQPVIEGGEVGHHFGTFMIGCSIPDEQQAFARIFLTKQVEKSYRRLSIASGVSLNGGFARLLLNRPIIGLALPKVGHRDGHALVRFTPDIAASIIPQQVTFVQIEDDQAPGANGFRLLVELLRDGFFFAATAASSRLGLTRWACLRVILAAANKS